MCMYVCLQAQQEENKQCPRLLATLTDHYGPVNVARFSRSGRLLATGSDDKLICLYELRAGAGHSSFGSNDGPNVENWKHYVTLRGHSNNVTDLAWSKDDTYLATCSLDNSIIIWNPLNGQQVTTLQGHESYVKGVAWDPIGKYLASQSDDRTVRTEPACFPPVSLAQESCMHLRRFPVDDIQDAAPCTRCAQERGLLCMLRCACGAWRTGRWWPQCQSLSRRGG